MADRDEQAKPITLFYSYSHRDEDLRLKLETHLAVLRRGRLIAEWNDRKLEPGDAWKDQIDRHLTSADIVLLLVSPDFFDSDYCWGEEMTKALERHERGEARVIPVILRHCRWQSTPLASLQAVPRGAKPIKSWPDKDKAFDDVAAAIERAVQTTRERAEAEARGEQIERLMRAGAQGEAELERLMRAMAEEEEARRKYERQRRQTAHATIATKPKRAPSRRSGSSGRKPGIVFRDIDAPWCPELVVIPAGSFIMGSPKDEAEPSDDEGPQHKVTFARPFALGRYPVTFEEYDHFCIETGREKPPDEGWGRGRRPVINVSWDDAQAYCAWLSEQTGQAYRLPSEAEWEYACRAETTTPFWTGATISTEQANYNGNYTYGSGRKGEYREQTTPVDTFEANPWGLHDMHGKVWEWCEDGWNDSYGGAPQDGSAGLQGNHVGRVQRGGSWDFEPWALRSAICSGSEPDIRHVVLGFRVSRTLTR